MRCTKFLINILRTLTVPKNDRTSDLVEQTTQFLITAILDSSAILPSLVQQCPTTQNLSTHNNNFFPEKVPPEYFICWTTLFTFRKCSQTNLLIPGFSSRMTHPPVDTK